MPISNAMIVLKYIIKQLNDCPFEWFDFHHECRNMKWKNISFLITKIESFLESNDYFMLCTEETVSNEGDNQVNKNKMNSHIMLRQGGCVRTNCMDCLDRTNVVQSVISRKILLQQLKKFDLLKDVIIDKSDPFFNFPGTLEDAFREIWTNHANQLSILYSGTNAQKTDFTRTGKRTIKGAISDGICGVKRYGINNFSDGYYQDCLDLLAGFLKPNEMATRHSALAKIASSMAIVLK
jgi:hypothetical protein